MIFIERYPLKRCQGCVKLIASKVNCFLNINDLSEVQLCMSSNSWTWECTDDDILASGDKQFIRFCPYTDIYTTQNN